MSAETFLTDFHHVATIGATPANGVDRQAATAEDKQTRDWFAGFAADRGWEVRVDGIGNMFALLEFDPRRAVRAHRLAPGQPAARRPVRRRVRGDRRAARGRAGGPARAEACRPGPTRRAQPRGGQLVQRGGRPLRPLHHGQLGVRRADGRVQDAGGQGPGRHHRRRGAGGHRLPRRRRAARGGRLRRDPHRAGPDPGARGPAPSARSTTAGTRRSWTSRSSASSPTPGPPRWPTGTTRWSPPRRWC